MSDTLVMPGNQENKCYNNDYYNENDKLTEEIVERLSDPLSNIKLFLQKIRQSLSKIKQQRG